MERKEGNVLFNDALNTFYLWLWDIRNILKNHFKYNMKPCAVTV